MGREKEDVLNLLMTETMAVLNHKKFDADHGPRVDRHKVITGEKVVHAFIKHRLVESKDDSGQDVIMFQGEYNYTPELWKTETKDQRRKIVNYVTYRNLLI